MRRLRTVLVALACGLLLSSCGPIGLLFDSSHQQADARMEQIAEALNRHDAAALKDMFSPYALEKATGFDEGVEYLLSFFPNGGVTWERSTVNSSGHNKEGKKSTVLLADYKLSVDGKDYRLFFADFIVNDVENSANVGIYGLGVTPWTEDPRTSADVGFSYWAGDIGLESDGEYGYPGIYVPRDDIVYPSEQADARMEQIATAVNNQDAAALTAMFSARALQEATEFDARLQSLLSMFPNGGLTWERLVVNTVGDDAHKVTKLLDSTFKASADGKDYWLSIDEFVVDAEDPENVGLASLAVTPWFEPGAPDKDQAYLDWTGSWDQGADGSTGIYVPTD